MSENLSNHHVEYPGYFSKIPAEDLLGIVPKAKDARARLRLAAAAYDNARTPERTDTLIAGRAAALACSTIVELNWPYEAAQNWGSRATTELDAKKAANGLQILEMQAMNAEIEIVLAEYLEKQTNIT